MLTEFGETLSEMKAAMPHYSISIAKGKAELPKESTDDVLKQLEVTHRAAGRLNSEDGLKIDFPDCWAHLRNSNTEPIIRVMRKQQP
jgi:phosphomannomutase